MSTSSNKRCASPEALGDKSEKRTKLTSEILASDPVPSEIEACSSQTQANVPTSTSDSSLRQKKNQKTPETKKRVKINKLAAPRPFPAVAASASATGPCSSHTEGKNYICLTRKTSLGAYMRRCKNLVVNDGYVALLLSRSKCSPIPAILDTKLSTCTQLVLRFLYYFSLQVLFLPFLPFQEMRFTQKSPPGQ